MTKSADVDFSLPQPATVAATRLGAQGPAETQVTLTLPGNATGPHMPADFVGLSYEVQQLVDPAFFSRQNTGLIRAVQGAFGAWRVAARRQHQ